ncbi:2-hydroxyacyl-CoA dehydratase, partial [Thermodesulfobacteriota bacterium]
NENSRKYLLAQWQDAIEWLEKKTGKEYDDERLIEGLMNEMHCEAMWAKCVDLLKNIPAPASMRDMYSLRLPLVQFRHIKETVDYVNTLYDELKDRVKNKISAQGIERLRLTHENLHPLYRADLLRSPEEYGAIFITGNPLEAFGMWEYTEDGSRVPSRTPEEKGIQIRSREDALNAIIDRMAIRVEDGEFSTRDRYYKRAKEYNTDAVVIHYDRPCQQVMLNALESKLLLQEKGIPVGVYYSSQGDPRDFDEKRILGERGELPTFYESLGLTRQADSASP